MAIHPISYLVEWKPAGSWVTIAAGSVVDFSGSSESAAGDIGVGFGDTAYTRASVQVKRSALGSSSTARRPIRITPTVDGISSKVFVGVITRRSGVDIVTLECEGILMDLSRRLKECYSPLFIGRAFATKTTLSSIEDPDDPDYTGGPINYGLWTAGGRPLAQAGAYPSADFYYECDQALFAGDYVWLANDDGYAELLRCARAAGGQLYQRDDGVVVYRQPFLLISTPSYTFSDTIANATNSLGVYGEIDEEEATEQYATKIVGTFTPRIERPMQVVIDDSTPRQLDAGEVVTINLVPDLPLTSIELTSLGALDSKAFVIQRYDGDAVPQSLTVGYNHSIDMAAQRAQIVVVNMSSWPHVIYRITLRGTPIAALETQTISVGSGTAVLTMEDNIFIQNEAHATRLAQVALAYYETPRKVRTLSECPYQPLRYVGETVALTDSALGITAVPHMIISREHSEGAAKTSYRMVDVSGLPVKEDYFLVSTTSQAGQTKKLTW
jgi:hypothetical protein